MAPICDHAACSARAQVTTTFDSGELTFCCHHWKALQAVAAGATTALSVDAACGHNRLSVREDAADGDWPALAA